jgi:beta-lactam-binding protein with PASTA domain
MKMILTLLAVLLISCMGLPHLANAVSWSPLQEEREEKAAQGIMEKGTVVCLFQSGTSDVKKAININDILPVYRESTSHELKEVGKIKVLSYVRDDYLQGEVIEGEIKAGDIAKKGDVASLIISSGDKCN